MPQTESNEPRRRWPLAVLVAAALIVAGGVAAWVLTRPDKTRTRGFGDYAFTDSSRIYLGRAALARNPDVVDSSRVYAAIPEYVEIQKKGLGEGEPRYHFLMVEASKAFQQALKSAARAAGHKVVAEAGTVHPKKPGAAEPPDITDAVLAALR